MLNKEVIETFVNDVNKKQNDVIYQTSMANAQWLKDSLIEVLQYIAQLEARVKELGKGQHTLMQSRKKWKSRYYKRKRKKAEWEQLCEECSKATKKAGFTKEDTDRIIKETREMQWKAQKYDELIDVLEKEEITLPKENIDQLAQIMLDEVKRQLELYKKHIFSILKGEKEV